MKHAGNLFRALLLLPLLAGSAFGAKLEIVRLSDSMLIVQEGRSRSFALNTARGIVVIDTMNSAARMRQAKELIEGAFKRHDYAFIVNTHDHPEHLGGNGVFPPHLIIGQDGIIEGLAYWKTQIPTFVAQTKKALVEQETKLAGLDKEAPAYRETSEKIADFRDAIETLPAGWTAPGITFGDRLTLALGDRTVKLIFFGRGHSRSDVLVYIPEEKVLLTGGACSLSTQPPFCQAWPGTMDIARWIEVLSEFADSDAELKHIIPGHAPHLTKADLIYLRDYYRTLWTGLKQARRDNETLEQAKHRLSLAGAFGDFPRLAKPTDKMIKQHEKNIDAGWAELNRTSAALPSK